MDWSKGYSAAYYMALVDSATWRDVGRIEITGGSIKREPSGLRESADIDCRTLDGEHWVRVYLDVEQGGSQAHEALFTGLATSPELGANGNHLSTGVECYSVLKPCDDKMLPRGWYASAGVDSGIIIKSLLSVTPAPVEIADGAPQLKAYIVAEDGETNLTMLDKVLTAIDWRIRISGSGVIRILPKTLTPLAMFDPATNDVIEPSLSIKRDWFECPNVFMAIADDLTAIVKDESDGPLSIKSRGREIWQAESGAELAASESIGIYAKRRLKELQTVAKTVNYDRRYIPDLMPDDYINLNIQFPEYSAVGLYRIKSQTVSLGHNAKTSETVSEVIV